MYILAVIGGALSASGQPHISLSLAELRQATLFSAHTAARTDTKH